ncbi:hypothetical protein AAH450_01140 [Erwinia sp. P7711]|uniref:hypothetical protein n=1 Tax=Erwinia sp. P7711 TaxID=3141451 RepID=UPI00319753DA
MKAFIKIASVVGVMFMLSGCIVHDGYRGGYHHGGGHHGGHHHDNGRHRGW